MTLRCIVLIGYIQRPAQIAMHQRVARRIAGRLLQILYRLRKLSQLQLPQAEKMEQFGVPRGGSQGLETEGNGGLEIAMLEYAHNLLALPGGGHDLRGSSRAAALFVFLAAPAGAGIVASGLHGDRIYRW